MSIVKIIIVGLLCYGWVAANSCTSESRVGNEPPGNVADSAYVKDSLAKEKQALSCDTPYKSVDLVVLLDGTNDDDYSLSFCSQIDDKGQVLSGGKPLPIKIPSEYFWIYDRPRYKISPKALHHLAQYIDENCECRMPIGYYETQTHGIYDFILIQGTQKKTCYLYLRDNDLALDYFKGMQFWLKESNYKNEYKKLLEYINRQIIKIEKNKVSG